MLFSNLSSNSKLYGVNATITIFVFVLYCIVFLHIYFSLHHCFLPCFLLSFLLFFFHSFFSSFFIPSPLIPSFFPLYTFSSSSYPFSLPSILFLSLPSFLSFFILSLFFHPRFLPPSRQPSSSKSVEVIQQPLRSHHRQLCLPLLWPLPLPS